MAKPKKINPNMVWVISTKCGFCLIYNSIPVVPSTINAKAIDKLIMFFFFILYGLM
jgi:hypothetical protein